MRREQGSGGDQSHVDDGDPHPPPSDQELTAETAEAHRWQQARPRRTRTPRRLGRRGPQGGRARGPRGSGHASGAGAPSCARSGDRLAPGSWRSRGRSSGTRT